MNDDIFKLISGLHVSSRKLRISDSDYVDIVNHHFVPLVFCVISIAICSKQYLVGDPIQCWVPKEYSDSWEQYAENYCWVENTYFVRSNESLKSSAKTEIIYYQWVPFVLILQGLLFYLPHFFWRMTNWMSGVDINYLMRVAANASTSNIEEKQKNISTLVQLFQESFGHFIGDMFVIKRGIYLSCCYIITKTFYIINIMLQFLIISKFIHVNFLTFGIRILDQFQRNIYWENTGVFPRVTFCNFEIRTIDKNQHYTLQCVLVVNMLIEKCYIAIWFLLAALLVANCINFLQWVAWFTCRRQVIQNDSHADIWDNMNLDSLFILRLLKKNCLGMNYNLFIQTFGEKTPSVNQDLELKNMM